jgi:phosphate transport system protein
MPTRHRFQEKLEELQVELLNMGHLVEESINKALRALSKKDENLAKQVIKDDEKINQKEDDIENMCAIILATEQPVARDLRFIISILKTIHELERVGDYATHLAKAAITIADDETFKVHPDLIRMTETSIQMLRETLKAFANQDAGLAEKVRKEDQIVDSLYLNVFKDLLIEMHQDPEHLKLENSLIFVAKFLERMADHIANICEEVIFMCTGKRQEKDWAH